MFPPLPKLNKKSEADFGLRFRKWWEKYGMGGAPYELKDSRGKSSIPFSEITDEQIHFALAAKSRKGILIRVEKGTVGSPDYVGFRNSPAWVVIRYDRMFYIIDIENFLAERERSSRKSLTNLRAEAIATVSVRI